MFCSTRCNIMKVFLLFYFFVKFSFGLSEEPLNFIACEWENETLNVLIPAISEYQPKFDFNCTKATFTSINQSIDYRVFKELTKDKKPNLNVEIDDNGECVAIAQPSTLSAVFDSDIHCIRTNTKVAGNGLLVTCRCYWHLNQLDILVVNYTQCVQQSSAIENIVVENLTVQEGEFVRLNCSIPNVYTSANVTWIRSVETIYGDKINRPQIIKYEIIKIDNENQRNSSLCLGNVRLNDSGTYEIRVQSLENNCNSNAFRQKYLVKVISSKVTDVQILAVRPDKDDSVAYKILDTRYLQFGDTYHLVCKAVGYPYPSLAVAWQPCSSSKCDNIERKCLGNQECWKKEGTIESSISWKYRAMQSGIINCSEIIQNGNQTLETEQKKVISVPLIVTNIKNAENSAGVRIELMEPEDQTIIENDTVTINLLFQKQYTAVVCKFCTHSQCQPIVKAVAKKFDNHPLKFASDWWIVFENHSLFQNAIEEKGEFSTALKLTAYYVSNKTHNGDIRCNVSRLDYIKPSSSIKLDIKQAETPWFTTDPKKELESEGYQPRENITLHCEGGGVPAPVVEWYDNHNRIINGSILFIEKFNETRDNGTYCCQLTNKVNKDNPIKSCVNIKQGKRPYDKNEFQFDTLSKLIFVIMTACTVVLLTVTPMSFQRRIARKTELEDLHRDLQYHLNCEFERLRKKPDSGCDQSMPVERHDQIIYDPTTEIPREFIKLISEIGSGIQSKVYKGELRLPNGQDRLTVAVKRTKEGRNVEQLKALLNEMGCLIKIGKHPNILGFIGACTSNLADGDLYIMVEYCEFGSLEEFLFNCKRTFVNELLTEDDATSHLDLQYFDNDSTVSDSFNDDTPRVSTKDLMSYAYQVAIGMEYISSKGVVHRDLALRNLLQTKDRVVKIADFGLSRMNNYYLEKMKGVSLPFKWMALESLIEKKYSTKSDVWSYGIVLWEIFSLSDEPYSNMPVDRSFFKWLLSGNRMTCPCYAPERLHNMMLECWQRKPEDRPTFLQCQQTVKDIYEELFHDSLTLLEIDNNNSFAIEPFTIAKHDQDTLPLPKPIYGTAYHTAVSVVSTDSDYGGSSPNGSMSKSVENLNYMLSPLTLSGKSMDY